MVEWKIASYEDGRGMVQLDSPGAENCDADEDGRARGTWTDDETLAGRLVQVRPKQGNRRTPRNARVCLDVDQYPRFLPWRMRRQ
jgi:hypothetical protein